MNYFVQITLYVNTQKVNRNTFLFIVPMLRFVIAYNFGPGLNYVNILQV